MPKSGTSRPLGKPSAPVLLMQEAGSTFTAIHPTSDKAANPAIPLAISEAEQALFSSLFGPLIEQILSETE